jgi:hypothetical protein
VNIERPYTLALSADEIAALVKYHTNCVKRVSNKMGKAALEHRGTTLLPSGRYLKMLHDEAKKISDSHIARAKGLVSLLQSIK